jgi:tetratricopeptide (TPR) repeat protein
MSLSSIFITPKTFALNLCLLIFGSIHAQDNVRLARSLFEKQEFQKASILYEDLLEKEPLNSEFYENLIQSLSVIKDFKKARKIIKKTAKISKQPLIYMVDECWIGTLENLKEKNDLKLYKFILEKSAEQMNLALLASDRFQMRNMTDEALEILILAEDVFGSNYNITNEIALLELKKGNRLQALERYLDMMVQSNRSFDQLKRIFDTYITDTADVKALQEMLMSKIKQYPHIQGLSEWLKWTFVELQDWEKAFIYTRSLDLRLKEDGYRMFELASLSASNGDLNIGIRCLDYILQKGENAYRYTESQNFWFDLVYKQFNEKNEPLPAPFELKIDQFLKDNSPSKTTINTAIIWANILNQKNEIDSAYEVIKKFIDAPYLDKKTNALAKIALADLLIQQGDVYQSELFLAQVEKTFKDEPIGQQAKFKRAELSFYRGDYEWANMQLDVLKGATTQLISNDAMELSLCITDNLGIDSNYTALEWYSRARLFQKQNRNDSAHVYLDKITKDFPSHSLSDEVHLMKAQLYEKVGDLQNAVLHLEMLIETYPNDIFSDNALFQLAQIYQFKIKNPEKAMAAYEKLIMNHTQSLYIAESRVQFRKLRGH